MIDPLGDPLDAYTADAYAMADGETPGAAERLVTTWDVAYGSAPMGTFELPPRRERHADPYAGMCPRCGVRGCRGAFHR